MPQPIGHPAKDRFRLLRRSLWMPEACYAAHRIAPAGSRLKSTPSTSPAIRDTYVPAARHAGTAGDLVVPALLGAAIFVPGHLFGWLVEWVWLGLTCFVCTLVIARRGVSGSLAGWSATTWLALLGAASGLSCVTLAASVAVRHAAFDPRDLVEMVRLPIYALFFIAIATADRRWNSIAVDRAIALSIAFIIGCTVVYFTRVPVLYQFLNDFLYSDAKVMFDAGYIRISFPFANPNFLAFYLLLVLAYTAFFIPRPLVFMGALMALFLTGSRSGWLAALPILIAAYTTYAYRVTTRSFGLGTLLVWSIPLASAALAIRFSEELQQFTRLAELVNAVGDGGIAGVHTADVRLAAAGQLLRWVERAPILGWGPGRGLGIDLADNQYLSWALAWGAVGTTIMLVTLGMLFVRLMLGARDPVRFIGALAFAASIAAILFTGDFLENYRLFFLFIVVVQACHLAPPSTGRDPQRSGQSSRLPRSPRERGPSR